MYLVYRQNPAGSCVSCVLTISPSFPIRFPSFWSHSHHLHCLSAAGHIARCQLSFQVSYKFFFSVASPMWLEHPIMWFPFPCFKSRSAPPPANPQLLVLCSRIAGTQHITMTTCKTTLSSSPHVQMLPDVPGNALVHWARTPHRPHPLNKLTTQTDFVATPTAVRHRATFSKTALPMAEAVKANTLSGGKGHGISTCPLANATDPTTYHHQVT